MFRSTDPCSADSLGHSPFAYVITKRNNIDEWGQTAKTRTIGASMNGPLQTEQRKETKKHDEEMGHTVKCRWALDLRGCELATK